MSQDTQKTLGRYNPGRVHVQYNLETYGSKVDKVLPMQIAILDDFSGDAQQKPYNKRSFIHIKSSNYLDIIDSIKPQINVNFELRGQKHSGNIIIKNIEDFLPINFLQQLPPLKKELELRTILQGLQSFAANNSKLYDIIYKIIIKNQSLESTVDTFQFASQDDKQYLLSLLQKSKDLKIFEIKEKPLKNNKNNESEPKEEPKDIDLIIFINNKIKNISIELGKAFDIILHQPNFQSLEATWRGIKHMISEIPQGSNASIKIFNCTKQELASDLKYASMFDKSVLFRLMYEESFGTYGGTPFTYAVLGHRIGKSNSDMELLRKYAATAAAGHIPTLCSPEPNLFGLDSFKDIYDIQDLDSLLQSPHMAAFRGFRDSEDSRYVSFILPNILGRGPYSNDYNPIKNLDYNENINNHQNLLWVNSAYYYAVTIAQSFTQYSWFGATIGVQNGGKISNLPVYIYKKEGEDIMQCPTEIAITDRKELQLSDAGFIALCHCLGENHAVVLFAKVIKSIQKYTDPAATANARLSTQLQHILNASRVAHFLKCMMRDFVGSFSNAKSVSDYLNDWLFELTINGDELDSETIAKHPFQDVRADIEEDPERPGYYIAKIYVIPHNQMSGVTISISLVTKLPNPKGDK